MLNPLSKALIGAGLILIVAGLFWQFGAKYFPLGRLPGDILIKRENGTFYFPVVSCILVSVLLSVVMYLVQYFKGK